MICRTVSIVIFFATLLGTGTFFSEIHPFTTVPVLREKFAWFAAHADEYDTLFIGTSRVYRGIKPSVFDELTAAAGCALEGSSSSGDLERRVYAQAMGCAVLVVRVGEDHPVVEGELGGFVDDVAGPTR